MQVTQQLDSLQDSEIAAAAARGYEHMLAQTHLVEYRLSSSHCTACSSSRGRSEEKHPSSPDSITPTGRPNPVTSEDTNAHRNLTAELLSYATPTFSLVRLRAMSHALSDPRVHATIANDRSRIRGCLSM